MGLSPLVGGRNSRRNYDSKMPVEGIVAALIRRLIDLIDNNMSINNSTIPKRFSYHQSNYLIPAD
jgi:hypothetical protein